MALYPRRPVFTIGLDIQPEGIHGIQLLNKGGRMELIQTFHIPIPDSVFVEDRVVKWEVLAKILKEGTPVLEKRSICIISLPTTLVRIHELTVPIGLSDTEKYAEMSSYFERDFQGASLSLAIDYAVVPSNDRAYETLLFTAAKQDYLNDYVNAVSMAGFSVKAVDVECYAYLRAILNAIKTTIGKDEKIVLLHSSPFHLKLYIFDSIRLLNHTSLLRSRITTIKSWVMNEVRLQGVVPDRIIDAGKMPEEISWPWPHQSMDPFSSIQFPKTITPHAWVDSQHDYTVALGLALYEVPQWLL